MKFRRMTEAKIKKFKKMNAMTAVGDDLRRAQEVTNHSRVKFTNCRMSNAIHFKCLDFCSLCGHIFWRLLEEIPPYSTPYNVYECRSHRNVKNAMYFGLPLFVAKRQNVVHLLNVDHIYFSHDSRTQCNDVRIV